MQNNYITKEIEGSEDCLYLNIFRPIRAIPLPLLLPVLVFLHGGAFKIGTSDPKFFQPVRQYQVKVQPKRQISVPRYPFS